MHHDDETGQVFARNIAEGIAKGIARGITVAITLFIVFVLFVFLGGWIVQWLWNWLVPSIFGLRALTFWEALGLLALSRILFGGFGRGGNGHGPKHKRHDWWKKGPPRPPAQAPMTTDVVVS